MGFSWACTVYKVQVVSLEEGVVDFDLKKQKSFGSGLIIYTALNRFKNDHNRYCD